MRAPPALLLVLVLVAPLALGLATPRAAEPGVRAVPGGFELTFPDGAVSFTHGPDPLEADWGGGWWPAPPRAPACVESPLERHHRVIYARPPTRPDRTDEIVPALRGMVALANGLVHLEASERGAPSLDLRMLCQEGQVQVDVVVLPLPEGRTASDPTGVVDYYRIVALLRAMGYDSPMAKHWVWYDDPSACFCGGMADAPLDIARSPNNQANTGPNYALTFGYLGASGAKILLHEAVHTMGAVSWIAPEATGGGHCNDGWDVMCYDDGAPLAQPRTLCHDRIHLDCNHDTYFDARAEPGTYLARMWNLASPANRFLQGCLYEARLLLPGASADIPIPPACRGARFVAFGEHGAPPAQAVYSAPLTEQNGVDVCWYAEETLLRCDARATFEDGTVPAGATRAVLTKTNGADPRVTLHVV